MKAADRGLLRPSVLTVCALATLLALGSWQLDRRADKHGLMTALQERLAAPELVAWAALPGSGVEFRRAALSGTFLHEREFRLLARSRDGRPGYHVVTPLRLAEGPVVLVDRGWMPEGGAEAERPEGRIRVEGVLRRPPEPGWAGPENRPDLDQWLYIDPAAFAQASGLALERRYYLVAGPGAPDRLPQGTVVGAELRDDHLQYALTWSGLALALAAVYGLWLGKQDQ